MICYFVRKAGFSVYTSICSAGPGIRDLDAGKTSSTLSSLSSNYAELRPFSGLYLTSWVSIGSNGGYGGGLGAGCLTGGLCAEIYSAKCGRKRGFKPSFQQHQSFTLNLTNKLTGLTENFSCKIVN